MSLSVCCLTGDPGPRVTAVLAPLRAVADEIVIAADARADQKRLEQYAAAADRLLRVEFSYLERHLAWLHKQCSGDWIFRIDADEVASPSLVERLPELIADCGVQQYWFPRRWLYPEESHWLEEVPWWPDYQNRLVRNDGTVFTTPEAAATDFVTKVFGVPARRIALGPILSYRRPAGNEPHPGKMLDMVMLVVPGGQERTEAEYRPLLSTAGFRLSRVVPTDSAVSVVEAVLA
jgi:hypothetical protein